MATVTARQASLSSLLEGLRGEIIDARLGYPDVLHVAVSDPDGDRWSLVTQDAQWAPTDPTDLVGWVIEKTEVGAEGDLRCQLSGGADLTFRPGDGTAEDDPPYWELITPGGVALEYGPGVRWQISGADDAEFR